MGVVAKQSITNLFSTYFGFIFGAVNVLFLYPKFLTPDYYGLVTFLLSTSNLIWPFMAFGAQNTLVKFFSAYTEKKSQDQLLSLSLIVPLIFGGGLGIIGFLGFDYIANYFEGSNELVKKHAWLIIVIAISIAYFEIFYAWCKVFMKSTFGNLMKEVFHRVCIVVLLLGLYFKWINLDAFIYALVGLYIIRTLIVMIYALNTYQPIFNFSFPSNRSNLIKYSFLIFIAGTVAVFLFDLDKTMIERYLPLSDVATYGIGVYIAAVIGVPQRAMHQITYPITASLLNQNKKQELDNLYKKSSITLVVVSGLIFCLILVNIQQLYLLIDENYRAGVSIVLLLGIEKLYQNLLANNNSILFNSDYYRFVLILGVLIVVLAVILNLIMIPAYGIYGAAYATFIAYFLYNTVKLVFVYFKFKMHPFSSSTGWVFTILFVFCFGFYFWEFPFHPLLNIALKSLLLGLSYLYIVIRLNLSEDISNFAFQMTKYFKK